MGLFHRYIHKQTDNHGHTTENPLRNSVQIANVNLSKYELFQVKHLVDLAWNGNLEQHSIDVLKEPKPKSIDLLKLHFLQRYAG